MIEKLKPPDILISVLWACLQFLTILYDLFMHVHMWNLCLSVDVLRKLFSRIGMQYTAHLSKIFWACCSAVPTTGKAGSFTCHVNPKFVWLTWPSLTLQVRSALTAAMAAHIRSKLWGEQNCLHCQAWLLNFNHANQLKHPRGIADFARPSIGKMI